MPNRALLQVPYPDIPDPTPPTIPNFDQLPKPIGMTADDINASGQRVPQTLVEMSGRGVFGNTMIGAMQKFKAQQEFEKKKRVYEQTLAKGEQGYDLAVKDAIDTYGPDVEQYILPKDVYRHSDGGYFLPHQALKGLYLGVQAYKVDKVAKDKQDQETANLKAQGAILEGAPDAKTFAAKTMQEGIAPNKEVFSGIQRDESADAKLKQQQSLAEAKAEMERQRLALQKVGLAIRSAEAKRKSGVGGGVGPNEITKDMTSLIPLLKRASDARKAAEEYLHKLEQQQASGLIDRGQDPAGYEMLKEDIDSAKQAAKEAKDAESNINSEISALKNYRAKVRQGKGGEYPSPITPAATPAAGPRFKILSVE